MVVRLSHDISRSGCLGALSVIRFCLPLVLTLGIMWWFEKLNKEDGDVDEKKIFAILFDLEMLLEALSELKRSKLRDDDDSASTSIDELKRQENDAKAEIEKIKRLMGPYNKPDKRKGGGASKTSTNSIEELDDKQEILAIWVRLSML